MRIAAPVLAAAAASLLAACASAPPRVEGGGLWTGRLSVRADATGEAPARINSGGFELSGDARRGQLVLTSPLGTVAARASWTLGGPRGDLIELDTGSGARRYPSLEAMMDDALGDALPLAAMFDWLAGRPWPGAPATPLPGEAGGPSRGFVQLGWAVDLSRLDEARLIAADREQPPPGLHVRVKLDPPAAATPTATAPASAASTPTASSAASAP